MMNSTSSRQKKSRLEKKLNYYIVFIFCMQLLFCSIAAIYAATWNLTTRDETNHYLHWDMNSNIWTELWPLQFIQEFGSWILIFTNFVPISLLVTVELVKFMQAYFIQEDVNIYTAELDLKTAVQSSNLNEELGQVSYIFSDKTGTLTCNIMEFKKMSIGNYSYGTGAEQISELWPGVTNVNFDDQDFFSHLEDSAHPNSPLIRAFLYHLAICHTVIIDKQGTDDACYSASSPDELALVNAAK